MVLYLSPECDTGCSACSDETTCTDCEDHYGLTGSSCSRKYSGIYFQLVVGYKS